MNAKIYTGTLIGPEGQTVGQFVKQQDAHNLQAQIDILREGLEMVTQAVTDSEAQRIARDVLEGHDMALKAAGLLN
jgi:hypothetical protein